MNAERFEILAEAFGGDVARWPEDEREAAAALMAAEPAWAGLVLAGASVLDDALAVLETPRASAMLTEAIIAGAPRARAGRRWIAWLLPAGIGAGLAAACAAGVLVGAQISAPVATPPDMASDALVTAVSDDDFSVYLDEEA